MQIESHLENLRESIEEIEEAVQKGLAARQRSLGFHASAAAVDMVEIILHQRNLISPGAVVKHEWFKSQKKVAEKFSLDFPSKPEILALVMAIELVRNQLCYGKKQEEKVLEQVVHNFLTLKSLFVKVSGYEL